MRRQSRRRIASRRQWRNVSGPKHGTRYHRLTMQRASDGQLSVTIDILGPIRNPLEGLPLADKPLLLLRPYGRTERALMGAVKGLPALARRAVAADILAERREQMVTRRQQ